VGKRAARRPTPDEVARPTADDITRGAARVRAILAEEWERNPNVPAWERAFVARLDAERDNVDAQIVSTFFKLNAFHEELHAEPERLRREVARLQAEVADLVRRQRQRAQRASATVRAKPGIAALKEYDAARAKETAPGAARKKIGKQLGISDAAVKSVLKRARGRAKE